MDELPEINRVWVLISPYCICVNELETEEPQQGLKVIAGLSPLRVDTDRTHPITTELHQRPHLKMVVSKYLTRRWKCLNMG